MSFFAVDACILESFINWESLFPACLGDYSEFLCPWRHRRRAWSCECLSRGVLRFANRFICRLGRLTNGLWHLNSSAGNENAVETFDSKML